MKVKQLIIGVAGIYFCYIFYGILQQRLFNTLYHSKAFLPAKFTAASAVGLFQFLLGTVVGWVLVRNQPVKGQLQSRVILGVFNSISLLSSNKALIYVSFPLQALAKSCKVLSVILASLLNPNSKSLSKGKLKMGLLFTAGVLIFNYFGDKNSNQKSSSLLGMFLLLISMLSDGVLAESQSNFKKTHHPSSLMLYFHHNLWSFVTTLAISILTNDFSQIVFLLLHYEGILKDLISISTLGFLGQFFIFYIIKNFQPHVLPMATSSRKMLTILVSILLFGHEINVIQSLGMVIVIGVIVFETFFSHKFSGKGQ